ncbi:class I SAM-dependent methyltransferase [Actinomadura litoris]|uniref:Methyltransferase domain-containing protein n=1 Tax=Actinomadura litoris TaxID=2678616 RepID=A0A7K1L062_9ACTN|nr:class I SAM-dependent methyltransferase [Actinomadura litoris]MUN37655.1 methyltransferase domain-containing protein [Actinomadura litoris]
MAKTRSSGTGPGDIAPDGSAVEFYAAQPRNEEAAALVHGALPPGASILELGAGAGRVTAPLVALGHPVTAVDDSAEMLARVTGARTVCSPIEDLDLPDRFGCVLMMSYLVNYGDRTALLDACRRHAAPDGLVIVQRETVDWEEAPRAWSHDGIDFRLSELERLDPERCAATIEYRMGERRWTHSFVSRRLGEEELPEVLAASGLRLDRFLDEGHGWVAARPA